MDTPEKTATATETVSVRLETSEAYTVGYRHAIQDFTTLIFAMTFAAIVIYRLTTTDF